MKNRVLAAAVVAALAGSTGMGSVLAQNTTPPANPNARTPAVANTQGNNPGAPAAGANSFTEAQAKSRIEGADTPTSLVSARAKMGFGEARPPKEAQRLGSLSTTKATLLLSKPRKSGS